MPTECPNVGKFLTNLVFSLKMENEIMGAILNDSAEPKAAADCLAEGQSRGDDALARWRDHLRRRRRDGCGQVGPRPLSARRAIFERGGVAAAVGRSLGWSGAPRRGRQ